MLMPGIARVSWDGSASIMSDHTTIVVMVAEMRFGVPLVHYKIAIVVIA